MELEPVVMGDQGPEVVPWYRWRNPVAWELVVLVLFMAVPPMWLMVTDDIVATVLVVLVMWTYPIYVMAANILLRYRNHIRSFHVESEQVVPLLVSSFKDEGIPIEEVREAQGGWRCEWQGPRFNRTIVVSQQGVEVRIGVYDLPGARFLPMPAADLYVGPVTKRTKALVSSVETVIDRELRGFGVHGIHYFRGVEHT